jgi:hypothetical protein
MASIQPNAECALPLFWGLTTAVAAVAPKEKKRRKKREGKRNMERMVALIYNKGISGHEYT